MGLLYTYVHKVLHKWDGIYYKQTCRRNSDGVKLGREGSLSEELDGVLSRCVAEPMGEV